VPEDHGAQAQHDKIAAAVHGEHVAADVVRARPQVVVWIDAQPCMSRDGLNLQVVG